MRLLHGSALKSFTAGRHTNATTEISIYVAALLIMGAAGSLLLESDSSVPATLLIRCWRLNLEPAEASLKLRERKGDFGQLNGVFFQGCQFGRYIG